MQYNKNLINWFNKKVVDVSKIKYSSCNKMNYHNCINILMDQFIKSINPTNHKIYI